MSFLTGPLGSPSRNGQDGDPGWRVLDDLHDWFVEHVAYVSPHHPVAVALWVAHTHALDRASSTPRLAFLSPEPESGKTRNLELLELVCRHGRQVVQISPAALYRWVAAVRPTILLDEADTVFGPKSAKDHEELRSLINAGHRPGANVPRVVGVGTAMRVQEFPAYCPVALAGLGKLPDTIRSRSIIVPMRRRAPAEVVRPYRERITRPEGEVLRDRLAAWLDSTYIGQDPQLPDGVTDRQGDQWEPLLAIADAAGGRWPEDARAACVEITAASRAPDDASTGTLLLDDLRTIFGDTDRLWTADIVAALVNVESSPWGEPKLLGDSKTDLARARWLARKLKPYGITSGDVRIGDDHKKGYVAADFADAWSRYLPPIRDNRVIRDIPGLAAADAPPIRDIGDNRVIRDIPGLAAADAPPIRDNRDNRDNRDALTRDVTDVAVVPDTYVDGGHDHTDHDGDGGGVHAVHAEHRDDDGDGWEDWSP